MSWRKMWVEAHNDTKQYSKAQAAKKHKTAIKQDKSYKYKVYRRQAIRRMNVYERAMQSILAKLKYSVEYQHIVEPYRVDFYLKDYKIAIEVDEPHHKEPLQVQRDKVRQAYIEAKEIRFWRIPSWALQTCPKAVQLQLKEFISSISSQAAVQ